MKTYLSYLIFAMFLFSNNILAQKCGSSLNMTILQTQNLELYNQLLQIENHTAEFEKSSLLKTTSATGNIIRIPVVVHVLYKTSIQNISDDQILSQIEVLNEDFRRLNADKSKTPSGFVSVASDPEVEFFLSCFDPNGNVTNGITRTLTDSNQFTRIANSDGTTNEIATRIKYTSLHGHDAWPTNRYLNIWICNLGGNLLGYAQFPGGQVSTDGVVIKSNCFGKRGTLDPTYNRGRTATHEIGHWLNLRHIWGDDDDNSGTCTSNECSGTDNTNDTPNQGERNYGCPTYPKVDCCSTTNPGVMFMNFMDYTDDACMNLFTAGQTNRMRSLFSVGGFRECFVTNPIINNWCQSLMSYSGSSIVCSSGSSFTVIPPSGCTVSWSGSSNLTYSSTIENTKLFTANGNGAGWVQATINSATCGQVTLPQKVVWVGPPNNSLISAMVMQGPPAGNQLCLNSYMTIAAGHSAIAAQGVTSYSWGFGNWAPYFQEYSLAPGPLQARPVFYLPTGAPSSQVLTISAQNLCYPNTTPPFQKTFYAITCGYSMVFSPNPANDNTEVTLTNTDETDIVAYTVKVTNNFAQTFSVSKKSGKRFTLPTSSLKDGLYIVEVVKGNEVYRENLVVKH